MISHIPKTKEECAAALAKARVRYSAMRFECAVGQRKDVREIREVRKEIAKLETAIAYLS
jgi:ribosomal protein L29